MSASPAAAARLAETLAWLCAVPSPTGEERALADALEARLRRLALAAPLRRHGDSLVVEMSKGTGGPRVALVGHLDVVRSAHDGPVRVEGDRLYGPGAADMKAGLALMLDALEHGSPPERFDLSCVFYAREEGPFLENELGLVLEAEPGLRALDLAICLEPSDNRLSLGACGSVHATARFVGASAHSARPWQGDNAIYRAAPLLARLAALAPLPSTLDGLVYTTVTSATMASGGRGRNVVPDQFELNLNHRFAPDRSLDDARRAVLDLCAGEAEVVFVDECPAAPPCAAHPLVQRLLTAGALGPEPKQAWTDVARFASLGVPAVNFGPGTNAQAHQRNEWTSLAKLAEGQAILARFFAALGEP